MGSVHGGYEWAVGNKDINDGNAFLQDDNSSMMLPILRANEYLSHDRWNMGADLEIPFLSFGKFLPFVKASWLYQHYCLNDHQNSLVVSAGIRF